MTTATVDQTAAPTGAADGHARPAVKRHHWIVRVTHWATLFLVTGMVASGLQIYEGYSQFGRRGDPALPSPFNGTQFPEWSRLGGWLAGALYWHFTLMWPLVTVGLIYLGYLAFSGEWKKLLFTPKDIAPSIEMAKYYLRIRKTHPAQGKHNALQKQAYSFIIGLGVLSVLTGVAIWKPVQFSWLTALFGGYQTTRYWHFWAVWLFVAFTVVHVFMVFFVDPATIRAMISGYYRGEHGREDH